MNNFPTKSFKSMGALRMLRLLSAELGSPIAVLATDRANEDPAAPLVSFAQLRIDPAGTVGSIWVLINPKTAISEDASRSHGIYDPDVKDQPSFETFAKAIAKAMKGAIVLTGGGEATGLSALISELERSGISPEEYEPASILDLNEHPTVAKIGYETTAELLKVNLSQEPAIYDRVMALAGITDRICLEQGISPLRKPGLSPLVNQEASPSPTPEVAPVLQNDGPTIEERNAAIHDWVQARVSGGEIFPSYSLKYLVDQLLAKHPDPAVDPRASAVGFAVTSELKAGNLAPEQLIHRGLFADLAPILSRHLKNPTLSLKEAMTSVRAEYAKPVDYAHLRAALMILRHPAYEVSANKTNEPAQRERKISAGLKL